MDITATAHDVEEMFLGNSFNVCAQSADIANGTGFIQSLVNISDSDEGFKLFCRKLVFPEKLPVNAGDVSIRVYQHRRVNDF